jgi:hypothetical protein
MMGLAISEDECAEDNSYRMRSVRGGIVCRRNHIQ